MQKRVHPHGLRHTHAVQLANEGVPLHLIRDQLGHASLATTDAYLRRLAPAERLERIAGHTWTGPGPDALDARIERLEEELAELRQAARKAARR